MIKNDWLMALLQLCFVLTAKGENSFISIKKQA